jgi:hypothetical protein
MKQLFVTILALVTLTASAQKLKELEVDNLRAKNLIILNGKKVTEITDDTTVTGGASILTAQGTHDLVNGRVAAGTPTRNGISKNNEFAELGGVLTHGTGIVLRNNRTAGLPLTSFFLTNRQSWDSLSIEGPTPGDGGSTVVSNSTESSQYNSAALPIIFAFREGWGNMQANQQYGGLGEWDIRQMFNKNGSAHSVAGGGTIQMPVAGLGLHNRWYPPVDSSKVVSWWDGAGGTVRAAMDIGYQEGYNLYFSPVVGYAPQEQPQWQFPNISSNVDFQRGSFMTGRRTTSGAGVAGFQSIFKSEQRTLNSALPNYHHNLDAPIVGYNAIGMVDNDLRGPGIATKQQIIDRSRVGHLYGFRVAGQRRPYNEVVNGYAFVAVGDSDISRMPLLKVGPGDVPYWVGDTALNQTAAFWSSGSSRFDGPITLPNATISSAESGGQQYTFITPKNDNHQLYLGSYDNGAAMTLAGKNNEPGYDNVGGANVMMNTETNTDAAFKLDFHNTTTHDYAYQFRQHRVDLPRSVYMAYGNTSYRVGVGTGSPLYRFHVSGRSYGDTLSGGAHNYIYSTGSGSDKITWFTQSDNQGRMIFGLGDGESATMQIAGNTVGAGYDNRGGVSLVIRNKNQNSGWERPKFNIDLHDNKAGGTNNYTPRFVVDETTIAMGGSMTKNGTYSGALFMLNNTNGLSVNTKTELTGGVRVQGSYFPTAGRGLEMKDNLSGNFVEAYGYDRDNGQYLDMGLGLNSEQVFLNKNGNVGIGNKATGTDKLDVAGSTKTSALRITDAYTPSSSADATGASGDVRWDDNYIYIKTSAGWKRSALTTF